MKKPRQRSNIEIDTVTTLTDDEPERGKVTGVLVAVDGLLIGESYAIFDGDNILGRGAGCDARFTERDNHISRRHANLLHHAGSFALEPLSDAVTRVDGIKIEKGPPTKISDGSRITLGQTEFRFRSL